MDVAAWLRELGLEQYAAAFIENSVSIDLLPSLTADDLKDLGVAAVGHRRRLLNAVAGLSPGSMLRVASIQRSRNLPRPRLGSGDNSASCSATFPGRRHCRPGSIRKT